MANSPSHGARPPTTTPAEIVISLYPDELVRYEGTSAQLIDEGLIPATSFAWPEKDNATHWQANGIAYNLRRCRPKDHVGPMRSWFAADHWQLVAQRFFATEAEAAWRKKEVWAKNGLAWARDNTPDGLARLKERLRRSIDAFGDDAFQDHMDKCLGLRPRRQG